MKKDEIVISNDSINNKMDKKHQRNEEVHLCLDIREHLAKIMSDNYNLLKELAKH